MDTTIEISEQILAKKCGVPVTLSWIDVLSCRIRVAQAGSGPSLVLLHGANIGWGQWYPNMASLARHFHVIAPDLPGSGRTQCTIPMTEDPYERFIKPISALIEALHIDTYVMVGHSLGGWVALRMAAQESRINKIIVINPIGFTQRIPIKHWPLSFKSIAHILARTAMKPSHATMHSFLADALHAKAALTSHLVDYYCAAILEAKQPHPFVFLHHLSKGLQLNPALVLGGRLGTIDQPTLVILGRHDLMMQIDRHMNGKISAIPHGRIQWFEQSGHVPSLEEPDHFNTAVTDFLLHSI